MESGTDRKLIERLNGFLFAKTLSMAASRYGTAETAIRNLLKTTVIAEKVISPYPLIWASDFMYSIYRQTPHWSRQRTHPDFLRHNLLHPFPALPREREGHADR